MKVVRSYSLFLLCFCLMLLRPFSALASPVISSDLSDSLVASDSDVIVNYAVAPLSSLGTVTNTVGPNVKVAIFYYNAAGTYKSKTVTPEYRNGRFYVSANIPDGYIDNIEYLVYKDSLPIPGGYELSFDFTSDFAFDSYRSIRIRSSKYSDNAEATYTMDDVPSFDQFSGDLYIPPFEISLSGNNWVLFKTYIKNASSTGLKNWGGSFAIHFTPAQVSSGAISTGPDTSQQDYQYGVSNTLNQIDDSLRNLIQHISDQLAALWDQMYNLMHVPTMAKLEEILAVLRAIGNNSDIYAVVEEVRDANRKEIVNDNANTGKVEQAVEKHGNFIIDGLKGLFIPSDDYFPSKFSELNDFFSDRFGFFYTPIDILIRFINLIINADSDFVGISFPELKWGDHVLLNAQTVNFDILGNDTFSELQQTLYFLTDLVMLGALLALIHRKFEEVMRN